MELFKNAGSEANLIKLFVQTFFAGNGDVEQNKIDLICNHITFEGKYRNKKVSIPEMYAQLIATHKSHNIPFKEYIGVFNENQISFMESKYIKERIRETEYIDWKSLTPSNLKEDIKNKIIQNIIPNSYKELYFNTDFEKIKEDLINIQLGRTIQIKEEITEGELKKVLNNLNKKLHKIKTLKDTDRSLFFSAIMIALNESFPLYMIEAQKNIYEDRIESLNNEKEKKIKQTEYNREAVFNISNTIIDTVDRLIKSKMNTESKQKWKNQFIFLQDLNLDIYEYYEIINTINHKIFRTFKAGQKQDILGRAYKIFLSKAGKVDNKNIILTPDHIKHLMIELADLNKNDIVLDTCMGTGGFLMQAMEKMETINGINKENLYNKQLIGSEINTKLFVLACSNMFLHGDGRSLLYDKDTINDDITFKYSDNKNGFFDYIKSLKPTKCIINPPYEGKNCFNFTKQALEFLDVGGKLIIIIKENTFQTINSDIEELLKYNTLDFYIKMPNNLFSEQNRFVATAIFGFTKGIAHPHNKNVKFYNLSDDGFENIPHNGRIDVKNIWNSKEKEIIEYIINDSDIYDKNIAYKEKIFDNDNLLPIYHHFTEEMEPICMEDFEEVVFDYFLYEQNSCGRGTISSKKLAIEILKNL